MAEKLNKLGLAMGMESGIHTVVEKELKRYPARQRIQS